MCKILTRREIQKQMKEIVKSIYSKYAKEQSLRGYEDRLTFSEFSTWAYDNSSILIHLLKVFRSHFTTQREANAITNIELSSTKESDSVTFFK
jgi:hypothetical protein